MLYPLHDDFRAYLPFIPAGRFVSRVPFAFSVLSSGTSRRASYHGNCAYRFEASLHESGHLTFQLTCRSTIFLNIHRFLDKTGYTGSRAQWINGVVLLSTFFSVRILYGWYLTIDFMRALFAAREELSDFYLVIFVLGNLTLNSLNLIWSVLLPPRLTCTSRMLTCRTRV